MDLPVINDYSEFSGMNVTDIIRSINNFKEINANEWNALPGGSFAERAAVFYQGSKNYIFDLLSVGYDKQAVINKLDAIHPAIIPLIKAQAGRTFLDFGGGLGLTCQIAHELGKDSSYLDIPGQVFDFARWRFKKYGLPVKMLCSSPEKLVLKEKFDIIFSDAVFEHLIDPNEIVRILCGRVNNSGLLIILVDLTGQTEEMPMHRDIDIVHIHSIIENNGFSNIIGKGGYCSVWQKIS